MPQGQPRENEVTFKKNGDKTCMYVCDLTNKCEINRFL